MAGRNRGTSPYNDSLDDGEYSDDFDDDATEVGTRRYKTRSPILRTASGTDRKRHKEPRPKDSHSSDSNLLKKKNGSMKSEKTRPGSPLGSNTYRKARGGMSLASGYYTPTSRKSVDHEGSDNENYTPRSKLSVITDYMSPRPGKESSLVASTEYKSRSKSLSPTKRVFNRSNRGRGRGRGKLTGRISQEPKFDNVAKRVMSARRLKINELSNANQELHLQIRDIKEENRLLKKAQLRQDKALQKFEDRESDLPQLIQRQNNEVRSYRDQIRKWREKFEKTDRYLRDAEDELEKVKIKLKKLKALADEKDLPERGELNKKLNESELDIEAKEVKIRELERHIQNLEKNHRHAIGIERARQKDINRQVMQLKEDNEKLQSNVKEKEKELQMKNIYANRMVKPPHRLPNSYNGTPQGTPPPRKRRPSLSENEGMTPRERAKAMEERRREELRKQREIRQKHHVKRSHSYASSHTRSPERRRAFAPNSPTPRDDLRTSPSRSRHEQHEKLKRDQELRKARERDERDREERDRKEQETERRNREECEQKEYEEREKKMNEEAEREEGERRNREERERMKRNAEDRQRIERERKEREEQARREKREREERERRDRERVEQERRAQEERRRFEDDVTLQAERKKKDEILQKLKEIDEGGTQKSKDKKKDKINDPFFVTQNKEDSTDSMASSNSKKEYKFTRPTENLHKGKPARNQGFNPTDPSSDTKFSSGPRNKARHRDIDGLETGGYNPTFGSHGGASKTATKSFSLFDDDEPTTINNPGQKSKLMEDLFGPKSDKGSHQDDIFAPTKPQPKKTSQSNNRSSFPWEDESNRKNSSSTFNTKRENSATLFGGGSALINDEDLHKSNTRSNATLSRRSKQPTTTFHTRPTVNAIDDIDNDIEEVIL